MRYYIDDDWRGGNIPNVPPEGFEMLLREVISPETKSRDLLPPEIAFQILRVQCSVCSRRQKSSSVMLYELV